MGQLRKTRHSTIAAFILGSLASLAASGARAELRPVFDQLLLFNSPATLPTIEVEAVGQNWTEVSTQTLRVTTNYYVSLKRGNITTIVAQYDHTSITRSRHPGGGKRRWGEFSFEIPNSQMGTLKNFAIQACKKKKEEGARTDETHTTYTVVPFELFVRAERFSNQSTRTVDGDVQAKVVCKKAPKQVSISHLDVKVDNSTEQCPKRAKVQVGFQTNSPDRIDFTLEHMNGGLQVTEHFAQPFLIDGQYIATKLIELIVDSNTEYVQVRLSDGSDFRRWSAGGPQGGEPILCPRSFKVISAWLSYDIENKLTCPKRVTETARFKATAPGRRPFEIKTQGGLVVHSGTAEFKLEGMAYVAEVKRGNLMMNAFESDMMALISNQPSANSGWVRLKVDCMEALSGTLELRRFAATRCEGEAALSIRASMPGSVPYRLDCTDGRSWSGAVQARETGPGTYIGVDIKRFDVSNNEQVSCALKTRAPLPVKVLAIRGNKYECHRPSGTAGTHDLAPETRPDPVTPGASGLVVIDPPRPPAGGGGPGNIIDTGTSISCAGGIVKKRKCLCDRLHKLVKAGKNSWRCVRSVVIDPPRTNPGGGTGSSAAGSRSTPGKTRHDGQAHRFRLDALKKAQVAKKRAQAERRRGGAAGKAGKMRRKSKSPRGR